MAVEVGIVGLQNAGKTTLFNALTQVGAVTSGKEHVGMAPIADDRLPQLAGVVKAKKITPAAIRVVDVPGSGAQLLGNLRQVDALLVVLDVWSGTRDPADDLETLRLELLVADRDHVERRLERVQKQAKSGDAGLRAEVGELERVLTHLDGGRPLSEYETALPPELEPLTTKPLVEIRNVAPSPHATASPSTTPWGVPVAFSAAATDPSVADTTAGFAFAWSFGAATAAAG